MTQRIYPVVKDSPDTRDHIAAPAGSSLPAKADLSLFLGPVKDQGDLGACTGFAFAGMREFLYRKFLSYEKKPQLTIDDAIFSPLFLYFMERQMEGDIDEDDGAQSRTGMRVLAKTGVCQETADPYSPGRYAAAPTSAMIEQAQLYRIGAYHRVLTLQDLLGVLASGYVSSMAIEVYESFESDATASSGQVPVPAAGEKMLGGHEVLAYGYDQDRNVVLVRNSWGKDWGLGGNFELPFGYFTGDNVMDMWIGHLGRPW